MTKQEFVERTKTFHQAARRNVLFWVLFAPLVILPFLMVFAVIPAVAGMEEGEKAPWWLYLALMLPTVGLMGGGLLLVYRWQKSLMKKHHVICPNCGCGLGFSPIEEIAIATGKCGRCGSSVWTDTLQPSS
jgi:hypothetical protein